MKKIVLLFGLVGLCLAFPFLQVSEKDIIDDINNPLVQAAANMALGEDISNERGCLGARLAAIIQVKHTGSIIGNRTGDIYKLDLAIVNADGDSVCCSSKLDIFENRAISVTFCKCIS